MIAPALPGCQMCQSQGKVHLMQNGKNSGLREKFGEELMQGGFTSLPNLVMNLYAALGITSPEMMFILQMWTHWYEKQEDMHPALTTIALRMNVSRRQAGRYVETSPRPA